MSELNLSREGLPLASACVPQLTSEVKPKPVPGRFELGFPRGDELAEFWAIRFAEERHAQGLFIGFARACDRSG